MASNRRVVVFNDFSKGEFGLLNPVESGPVGKSGMWTGLNMLVLPNGELCPRNDPKPLTTDYSSASFGSVAHPNSAIVDMGVGYDGNNAVVWFKAGDKINQSGPSYAFTALTGTTANAAAYLDHCASDEATFALTSANLLEKFDHSALTVALVGAAPTGSTVCQYGDRLMVGGRGANQNRLYFSAAGDFATWPAANYIDIGDSSPIVALVPLRSSLLICKGLGLDDAWWSLRGVPGVNAVVRPSSKFPAPQAANRIALLDSNKVASIVESGIPLGGGAPFVPASFNGTAGVMDSTQAYDFFRGSIESYRLLGGDDRIVWARGEILVKQRGAWSHHTLAETFNVESPSASVAFESTGHSAAAGPMLSGDTHFALIITDKTHSAFYAWEPYPLHPALESEGQAVRPTAAECYFTLPEWWAANGEQVSVAAISVDFTKWGDGSSYTNSFSVRPVALGREPDGDTGDLTPLDWSEADSAATETGTKARKTFTFAPDWGNAFRIEFTNVAGVTIRAVTVHVDTGPVASI